MNEIDDSASWDMMSRVAKNPISAAPIIMSAFSSKKKKEDQFEFTDPNYMSRGSPELNPDGEHVWAGSSTCHSFIRLNSK